MFVSFVISAVRCEASAASHLFRPFLGSLVEDGRAPHQRVRRMRRVAAIGRRAAWRGRHGSTRLAHGGHGPRLLKHVPTQDAVVVVVVLVVVMAVVAAALAALLHIRRLHLYLWPQWRAVGPAPS